MSYFIGSDSVTNYKLNKIIEHILGFNISYAHKYMYTLLLIVEFRGAKDMITDLLKGFRVLK